MIRSLDDMHAATALCVAVEAVDESNPWVVKLLSPQEHMDYCCAQCPPVLPSVCIARTLEPGERGRFFELLGRYLSSKSCQLVLNLPPLPSDGRECVAHKPHPERNLHGTASPSQILSISTNSSQSPMPQYQLQQWQQGEVSRHYLHPPLKSSVPPSTKRRSVIAWTTGQKAITADFTHMEFSTEKNHSQKTPGNVISGVHKHEEATSSFSLRLEQPLSANALIVSPPNIADGDMDIRTALRFVSPTEKDNSNSGQNVLDGVGRGLARRFLCNIFSILFSKYQQIRNNGM